MVLLTVSLAASAIGCGDSADKPPAATATPFSLSVTVPGPGGPVPLAGAAVALDPASGARAEVVTGADGRASFNADLSSGAFAFTVAAPGYVAVSNENLRQPGDWRITLQPVGGGASLVDLTGIVHGKTSPDHFIYVTSTAASSTAFGGLGPEYSLRVPPNAAFTAVVAEAWYGPAESVAHGDALDFVSWASFAMGPFGDASIVDLILPGGAASGSASTAVTGQSLMPAKGSGTLRVPASMHGATGGLRVSSSESGGSAYQGGATSIALAADGVDLEFDSEYVTVPGGRSLTTSYWVQLAGASSYAYRTGAPEGSITFLDPPVLASPQTLYSSLPVQNVQSSTEILVNVATDDSSVVWRLYNSGLASDGFRMPHLPSSIDPRTVLGTGRVTARPIECQVDSSTGDCTDVAVGAYADLVNP